MPSIEESKRQVKASLQNAKQEIDHDAILASLQDEIDQHNEQSDDDREERHRRRHRPGSTERDEEKRERPLKFRFKSGTSDPRDRKRRKHHHRRERSTERPREEEAAHPFPREPTKPAQSGQFDANAAFRDSLFDALADDEGAAYWESVYSQPIHVYPRPSKETPQGELEQMNDAEYAAYVQAKMWEKKHPEIMQERERKEKHRKQEEEEKTKRREEFVRRKQRSAWERAERDGARKFAGVDGDAEYEYEFDFEGKTKSASKRSTETDAGNTQKEYVDAWQSYLAVWDTLKHELLNGAESTDGSEPSRRIPWPVLARKAVTKPNIEDFMQNIPQGERSRLQVLKTERVKWHPDKIQQRFGGKVDAGTMKVVTGVFHVVDAALEEERGRS